MNNNNIPFRGSIYTERTLGEVKIRIIKSPESPGTKYLDRCHGDDEDTWEINNSKARLSSFVQLISYLAAKYKAIAQYTASHL